MKKIFILASAASLLFISCVKNEMDAPKTVTEDAPEYISASIPGETKVHLDGLKTSWHETDRISLFAKSDAMHFYSFDEFKDGEGVAAFKYHSQGTDATISLDKNYCIYPDRGVTGGVSDNTASSDGILTTRIVYNQAYSASNLLDHAPMIAVSDNYEFDFINVASVLRLNVKKSDDFTGTCILETIGLNSASQYLSGTVAVDTKVENPVAVCEGSVKNRDVNLTGIDVEITTEAQPFCIVVFPASFPANDLTITLHYNDGSVKSVKYPSELIVGAGKVQDINCTIKPEFVEDDPGVEVTTRDIFEFNGHPHLTCYTASVVASVTGGTVSEAGVLCMKNRSYTEDKLKEYLVSDNVDRDPVNGSTDKANYVHMVTSELVDGKAICTFTDRVKETSYAYRAYAKTESGDVVYGDVKYFKTENYGQFVDVPAGSFTMGANSGQTGYNASYLTSPAHDVTISAGYQIGKYEVSVEEYIKFAKEVNATITYSDSDKRYSVRGDGKLYWCTSRSLKSTSWETNYKKYPVDGVTYYGAVAYCEWMTANDDTYEYRLPTEAEWEYAQRGGSSLKNYVYSGSNTLSEVAVTGLAGTAGPSYIQRIGEKYPNELGVHDMSGNLWEFVSDRSDKNLSTGYFELCKDGVTDPQGPSDDMSYTDETFYCVVKGGSANEVSGNNAFAVGYRRNDRTAKSFWHNCGGFRIVRVPKAE